MSGRVNDARLYATVLEEPIIKEYTDPDTKKLKKSGMMSVLVFRSGRKTGETVVNSKTDALAIYSMQPDVIEVMSKLKKYDLVNVKGVLQTDNRNVMINCRKCGHANIIPVTVTFIYAIHIKYEGHEESLNNARDNMRSNKEISNNIMLAGRVCRAPDKIDDHESIANYQLDVRRKYYIKGAYKGDKHDFPWIKSYGKQADLDFKALKAGSYVLIDGTLNARSYTRRIVCGAFDEKFRKANPNRNFDLGPASCGEIIAFPDTTIDVIPHAVEYIKNYNEFEMPEFHGDNRIFDYEERVSTITDLSEKATYGEQAKPSGKDSSDKNKSVGELLDGLL